MPKAPCVTQKPPCEFQPVAILAGVVLCSNPAQAYAQSNR